MEWLDIETAPKDELTTYLVKNRLGQVAPIVRGVIQNNVGTPWDWNWGAPATGWMPMPPADIINSAETLKQQRDELLAALKLARAELDKLPRSLGYDFDHIPAIDEAIAKCEPTEPVFSAMGMDEPVFPSVKK